MKYDPISALVGLMIVVMASSSMVIGTFLLMTDPSIWALLLFSCGGSLSYWVLKRVL